MLESLITNLHGRGLQLYLKLTSAQIFSCEFPMAASGFHKFCRGYSLITYAKKIKTFQNLSLCLSLSLSLSVSLSLSLSLSLSVSLSLYIYVYSHIIFNFNIPFVIIPRVPASCIMLFFELS